jgi:hypothetical protein
VAQFDAGCPVQVSDEGAFSRGARANNSYAYLIGLTIDFHGLTS